MRKLFVVLIALTAAFAVAAAPAAAHRGKGKGHHHAKKSNVCSGTLSGKTLGKVVVPKNGSCTLLDSKVKGGVKVAENAYFQATGTRIYGDVRAKKAQTVFIDTGSKVSGDVDTERTSQVYVFNSKVYGTIDVYRSDAAVQVCGTYVRRDIEVRKSARDILIGDPLAVECAGNRVKRDVEITQNDVDIELVVRGNTIGDDLTVWKNTGAAAKFVQDNVGGDRLSCKDNAAPFTASGNTGWSKQIGQCASP